MAATPIDPRVADVHHAAMMNFGGNAHSAQHSVGAAAQAAMDEGAASICQALNIHADEFSFTPGASAALWLAVEDAIARASNGPVRIAATTVEHPALLSALQNAERSGRLELSFVPVDTVASPRLDEMEVVLARGVDLLCTMAANNEVGTLSDLHAISELANRYGARHLIDASQAAGRLDPSSIPFADLLIVSGAKVYGPRRIGALIGRLCPHARQLGHDVFGSPDAPAAVAFAHAVSLRRDERQSDEARIMSMRDKLEAQLVEMVPGLVVNGSQQRLSGCLHVSTPHIAGEAVVARLWGQVAVSTGAACQSGVPGPSHVLSAMGVADWVADGAVRIGIGKFNTEEDIDHAADLIGAALNAEPMRRSA